MSASQINELIKQPSEGSDDFNELPSYIPFTFWAEKLERGKLTMGSILFLRFYYCSLSFTFHPYHHQAQRSDRPSRSFCQARESICSSCMHADRQQLHMLILYQNIRFH